MKINGNKIAQLIKVYTSKQEDNLRFAPVKTHQNGHASQSLEISTQATEILRIREFIEEQAAALKPAREIYLEQIETQLGDGEYEVDGREIALKMVRDTIDGLIM